MTICTNAGLMLVHRLRRWPSINLALEQRVVVAWFLGQKEKRCSGTQVVLTLIRPETNDGVYCFS